MFDCKQSRACSRKEKQDKKKSPPKAVGASGGHCIDFVSLQKTKYPIKALYCEDTGKSTKRQ